MIAFVPHVRRIKAAKFRHCASQCRHFFGIAVTPWAIDQSTRKPACSLLHGEEDVLSHQAQFVCRRCGFRFAHHKRSDGVVANKHHVVDRGTLRQRCPEVTFKVRKVATKPGEDATTGPAPVNIWRSRNGAKATVAIDDGRYALGKLEGHIWVPDKRAIIMSVRIDESRR